MLSLVLTIHFYHLKTYPYPRYRSHNTLLKKPLRSFKGQKLPRRRPCPPLRQLPPSPRPTLLVVRQCQAPNWSHLISACSPPAPPMHAPLIVAGDKSHLPFGRGVPSTSSSPATASTLPSTRSTSLHLLVLTSSASEIHSIRGIQQIYSHSGYRDPVWRTHPCRILRLAPPVVTELALAANTRGSVLRAVASSGQMNYKYIQNSRRDR
jgi:hypothetical protein